MSLDPAAREANRQKALARLAAAKERMRNPGSAASTASSASSVASSATASSRPGPGPGPGPGSGPSAVATQNRQAGSITPAKFKNYVDYDFSKIRDTRAGFMANDDEQGQGLSLDPDRWKIAQKQTLPPVPLTDPNAPKCFECGTNMLDFRFYHWFKARVCHACKKKFPDKYSLLTKTECRQDYLLTEPELRDETLLPHVDRPNPHKTTYNNMMLYLRYQVEEYGFKKWNGPNGLDAEYERRQDMRKKRKDKKFLDKLREMRRKTRAQNVNRRPAQDVQHEHEWAEPQSLGDGRLVRTCFCGMQREELDI